MTESEEAFKGVALLVAPELIDDYGRKVFEKSGAASFDLLSRKIENGFGGLLR